MTRDKTVVRPGAMVVRSLRTGTAVVTMAVAARSRCGFANGVQVGLSSPETGCAGGVAVSRKVDPVDTSVQSTPATVTPRRMLGRAAGDDSGEKDLFTHVFAVVEWKRARGLVL